MSIKNKQEFEDFKNVEIAIELDRGKTISEVAEEFQVSKSFVKKIARKTTFKEIRKIKPKKRRFSIDERTFFIERIINGGSLEEIAADAGITENTLKRWCKNHQIILPRGIYKISNSEKKEIRELLEDYDWEEISKIYNINKDAIRELSEPAHNQLNSETLSYLFELLREKPQEPIKSICRIMKKVGLDVVEDEVISYKKRLKSLNMI